MTSIGTLLPQAAEERALALLRSLLPPDDVLTWEQKKWLGPIVGSDGGLFAFSSNKDGKLWYQVWELSPVDGSELYRWCVVPRYMQHLTGQLLIHNTDAYGSGVPPADWIISILLLLQADEAAFRKIALCQWDHRKYGEPQQGA